MDGWISGPPCVDLLSVLSEIKLAPPPPPEQVCDSFTIDIRQEAIDLCQELNYVTESFHCCVLHFYDEIVAHGHAARLSGRTTICPVMLNEAKTSRPRPRPELRAEAEINFWSLRRRQRPKIIMKKYQIMINNIRFKIIDGKINNIPEFYRIFARKMPDYIIRQRD